MTLIIGILLGVAIVGWIGYVGAMQQNAALRTENAELAKRLNDAEDFADDSADLTARLVAEIVRLKVYEPIPYVARSETPIGDGVVLDLFKSQLDSLDEVAETWTDGAS